MKEKKILRKYTVQIAKFIVEKAKKEDLVYAVPGHPRVAEKTVGIIEFM